MIMLATKVEKSSSPSQLPSAGRSEKSDSNDFSKLLHSISSKEKTDKHSLKDGALVLKLNDDKDLDAKDTKKSELSITVKKRWTRFKIRDSKS